MLEKPVAVIAAEQKNRIIVITQYKDKSGNNIMVPVIIGTNVNSEGNIWVTANIAASAYGKRSVSDMLTAAIEKENSGQIAIFGADKKITSKLPYSGLQLSSGGGFDVVHNIADAGINVKSQTETLQFKKFFKNSKVVDADGKPLVVYHGTSWRGWEFDQSKAAWFSEKEDYAEEMAAQRKGDRIIKAYLSIQNPMVVKVPPNKMADSTYENKIIAEAKAKGHDGVRFETDTNNEIERDVFWVAFDPAHQVKSATDNIGTFDVNNPDIRFTLNSNASEELRRQVKAMQACVGPFLDQDGAEYTRRFKEKYGISIDPDEAIVIAQLAISENKSAYQKKVAADNAVRAWAHFKSFNPLFDFIANFAGDDFKINPGTAFAGDEFTGTFITPEYRKYSVKRRQKPGESDAKYRQYLAKREKALAKVSGTPLDEVAQAYARESGRELKDVQEEIIDLLRNLQRTDIISQYKKYKDDQIAADNAELEALRRATEDQQRRQIEEEAATVIQSQSVIDADWAKANSKVPTQENEMDIDFDPPMMELEIPSPSRVTLTPPKARQYKRVFREVKTDLRVELSNELWKRQCTDLTIQVCKRPPLPCLLEWDNGMSELAILPTGYQDELQDFLQYHISIDTCLMKEGISSDISSVSVNSDYHSFGIIELLNNYHSLIPCNHKND